MKNRGTKEFCLKWGHDTRLILDNKDVTVESCKECDQRLIYNKVDGRIDNKRYFREHYRDYLQHNEKDFDRFYSSKQYKKKEHDLHRAKQQMIDQNNEYMEARKAQLKKL